jgi:uncharacterized protein (TIGR01244 family)
MLHRAMIIMLALASPAVVAAQQFTKPGPVTPLPRPEPLDTTGRFLSAADRVGDVIIAGQPTERALRELQAAGVTTVVNLRTPPEMTRNVPFDEGALVRSLGMTYVTLPVRGDSAYPYAPETITHFAAAVRGSKGKVLLHCTVGWRASHLWAAYLIQERGVPVDDALANARSINLMDAHHMTNAKRQPVEDFLGRDLPTLGHP